MSYSEREPSILLCEERMFDRVAKNKFKGSWSTYVTLHQKQNQSSSLQ